MTSDSKTKTMAQFKDAKETLEESDVQESIKNIDVFKVGIRVPPFWPEEPDLWFAQIEGQFSISGITNDSTKFFYVISQLDNNTSIEVKDIIINPPSSDKYTKLKSELIKRLTASKEKRLKTLLMHEELGDRKPSQFLRHLNSLAGVNVPVDFLKTIWISRLSHGIQTVLAGQPPSTSLDDLADLADRVHEIASPTPTVAAMSQASTSSTLNDLAREVAELRKEFRKLASERHSRNRTPTRGTRQRSRVRSTSQSKRSQSNYKKYPNCWYHNKFGDKANKCIQPCDFTAGNERGGR